MQACCSEVKVDETAAVEMEVERCGVREQVLFRQGKQRFVGVANLSGVSWELGGCDGGANYVTRMLCQLLSSQDRQEPVWVRYLPSYQRTVILTFLPDYRIMSKPNLKVVWDSRVLEIARPRNLRNINDDALLTDFVGLADAHSVGLYVRKKTYG